jgi:hypothetical protein
MTDVSVVVDAACTVVAVTIDVAPAIKDTTRTMRRRFTPAVRTTSLP